jgi:hypothetical protein
MTLPDGEGLWKSLWKAISANDPEIKLDQKSIDKFNANNTDINEEWVNPRQGWSFSVDTTSTIEVDPAGTGLVMPVVEDALGVLHYKNGKFYVTDWDKSGRKKGKTVTKEITSIEDLLKIAIKKGLRG